MSPSAISDASRRTSTPAAAAIVATTPFVVHDTFFTWPKLLTAAVVLAAAHLILRKQRVLAGGVVGIAYLIHPLALLSLPVLALFAIVLDWRSVRTARLAPFLFPFGSLIAAIDRKLSEQMQKYWTNFARTGDPNGGDLPKWPAYESGSGWQTMYLSASPEARKDDMRDRYLFLDHGSTPPNFAFENKNGKWTRVPNQLDNLGWFCALYNKKDQTYWVAEVNSLVHYSKEFRVIKAYSEEDGTLVYALPPPSLLGVLRPQRSRRTGGDRG